MNTPYPGLTAALRAHGHQPVTEWGLSDHIVCLSLADGSQIVVSPPQEPAQPHPPTGMAGRPPEPRDGPSTSHLQLGTGRPRRSQCRSPAAPAGPNPRPPGRTGRPARERQRRPVRRRRGAHRQGNPDTTLTSTSPRRADGTRPPAGTRSHGDVPCPPQTP